MTFLLLDSLWHAVLFNNLSVFSYCFTLCLYSSKAFHHYKDECLLKLGHQHRTNVYCLLHQHLPVTEKGQKQFVVWPKQEKKQQPATTSLRLLLSKFAPTITDTHATVVAGFIFTILKGVLLFLRCCWTEWWPRLKAMKSVSWRNFTLCSARASTGTDETTTKLHLSRLALHFTSETI